MNQCGLRASSLHRPIKAMDPASLKGPRPRVISSRPTGCPPSRARREPRDAGPSLLGAGLAADSDNGLSHRTVVYTLGAIRRVLAYGISAGLIATNVAAGVKAHRNSTAMPRSWLRVSLPSCSVPGRS